MNTEHKHKPDTGVTFSVDGVEYMVDNPRQNAASILGIAGVDPSDYDLGQVKNNGDTRTYSDTKPVHINDGDVFVTVRTSAPVA